MTVEEKGSMGREEGPGDQFPIGMRVLAVDDDPICLKLLEALLLRCQYHVTMTNQAIKALNMLRDNKDKFDLVISDVHMPDMDGFKLLEHVGLEMDLPVIMLSANGETKAVMKGITHGACDYLLKPVRIEELRNIWQHVVRRRRFDHKEHYYLDHGEDYEKSQAVNSEETQGAGANGASDHNGKVNRKTKDQNDEDEDDCDENNNEGEDPSTQKKARVVWSVDLHRKFVAAVNQMGIDKAVPKRILDLMNVDKLTRENVASHLQKYRLYLKRLSAVASQQANMAAALGGRDASNLHLGTLNGFANYGISPSGQLQGLTPFQPCGLSNRMNPNFLGLPGLAPGAVQISHIQRNTNNHMNDLSKFQQIAVPANQHENLLQGIPTSLERDQLQQKQKRMHESNNLVPGVRPGASCNTFIGAMDTSLLLQGHQQQTQLGGFGNQSSVAMPSIKVDRLEMSCALSSHLPVISRSKETWETAPSLSTYNSNILPIRVPYSNNSLASSNMGATITSTVPQLNGNPLNISSNNLLFTGKDSLIGRDMQNQTSLHGENTLLMPSGIDSDSKYVNFRSVGSLGKNLKEPKLQNALEPNTYSSSLNSTLTNQILQNTVPNTQRLQDRIYDKMVDTRMMGQPSLDTAFIIQPFRTDKSIVNNRHIFNEESMLGTSKMHGGFASNGCNFDELMNAIIKPERDDIGFVEGEICSDLFPLSTCM